MDTDIPPINFAPSSGARLAWQAWGDGPATIVAIPPLAQNIETAWEWPPIRRMLERFGSFSRYLHFDKRGTGASDRRSRMAGIDERVEDLRAVMDHADIARANFFVQSDGGPMALLFTATYPDRVESLTLFGTGATLAPGWPEKERVERRDRMVAEWGTPDSRMVENFAPSLAADQEFRTWHQRYERQAASSESLRELLDLSAEMDVHEVLPKIDVPTLVIHRAGDRIVPITRGRDLARSIPGARMLELDGDDHWGYVGDLDPWMSEVERFVTGETRPRPSVPSTAPAVRILTLGGFRVEIDGTPLPTSLWGSRLARQLCKRLVAARGWPVTRDELIDMLWPDESDMRKLGARLSVQLSSVRRVLGGAVIADRQTVRLDMDEVSTDLEDFYKAVDHAAVVAAYPGEFLPEDRYEDWSIGPRDEARARFVAAARDLAAREAELGNSRLVSELGRRLIEADPYDEAAHRLVVQSLLYAGDKSGARRAHRVWAAAMGELDVDVEPFGAIADS